jgi:type II secretory pathway pseudopilin PulG
MIIIGILAAIAIPIFLNQRGSAYEASLKSDLRTYANELESYNTDYQSYPTSGFVQATGGVLTIAAGDTVRVSAGNTFTYVPSSTGKAFCLVAANANSPRPWEYISDQGGLQPAGTEPVGATLPTTCTAGTSF